jgi:hypothetical protein
MNSISSLLLVRGFFLKVPVQDKNIANPIIFIKLSLILADFLATKVKTL